MKSEVSKTVYSDGRVDICVKPIMLTLQAIPDSKEKSPKTPLFVEKENN